jgi:TPR repeat protein
LLNDCQSGRAGACYSLAMAYDRGQALDQNAERATYYYEKACTGGVPGACTKLGKEMPPEVQRALVRRRNMSLAVLGAILLAVVGVVIAAAVFLWRTVRGSGSAKPRPRSGSGGLRPR